MHDMGPDRPVIIDYPDRVRRRESRERSARAVRYLRSKNGALRLRMSGPRVRRASEDFGPQKPEGYVFSENYVAQSYNSTAWYIACGALLIIGLVIVASRSGGVAGLGIMFALFLLVNLYRFYRKTIKPKFDAITQFFGKSR